MGDSTAETQEAEPLVAARYRVTRLLGQGGMGSVHEVVDETNGQHLALKRLHTQGLSDTRVSLFEREYQTLASLRHPRIVRVFDYGVDADGAFYTMELLEGDDLASVAPLPWRDACLCLRDVASILGVLHARRLVHRDLSPRNLWRTPDGRLKLLDFGALAPFGPTMEIVGTPPLTAPEVLRGHELDARTDLFALGALGYWLLTSTHAFPAREMAALEGMWSQEPTAPSRLVQLIKTADHSSPEGLDELIASLLRLDPAERPRSTVDVVDSLNAIAELEPEAQDVVQSGYLDSVAFVARRRQRSRFESALARAHNRKASALSFEGPEGIGRSRLLSELSLLARLSGAAVLSLDAQAGERPYALAGELGQALITALPDAARAAAEPRAARLASCTRRLASLLGATPEPDGGRVPQQVRADRLEALRDWILAVSAEHTLVLFVDDLHRVDEPSQSLLAMLAHGGAGSRLLLVTSTPTEHLPQGLNAHASYRQAARCMTLPPFSADDARELLHSTFGDAPNLQRTAARLCELSEGRPFGILTLARHLVQSGAIEYREGAWVLPLELPEGLPTTRSAEALTALTQLSPTARALAADLSVPDYSPVSMEMCRALPGRTAEDLQAGLDELRALDLLKDGPEGLEVCPPGARAQLLGELAPSRRREVHRAFATALLPKQGQEARMELSARIGMHWMRAGDRSEAQQWLVGALRAGMEGDIASMRQTVPAFEDWLAELDAVGANDFERAPALIALASSGYVVDQVYAKRYGDETRRVLEGMLMLPLARALRFVLGGKLALLVTLVVASIRLKVRHAPIALAELLTWFMTVMSSLAGGCAATVDSAGVRAYAKALSPFRALGNDHVAGLVPLFTHGLVGAVEDRPHQSWCEMQEVIERLESDLPVKGMEGDSREYIRAGALYCNGVRLNLANHDVREVADEIAKVGPLQALTAEFLRYAHHSGMGDTEAAREARERVELRAIQLGSGWQAECLAPMQDVRVAFWTWDAVAMKRAAQDLALLARRMPSVGFFEPGARASYELIRGRYERARDLVLESQVEPLATVGWARHRGVLAAAYNGLGEHQRAREVCEDVLTRVSDEDLDYVQLFLQVQVEHAVALHGVGETEAATALLDGFLERYCDRGPLILGYIHRARAQLALAEDDFEACERHVEALADLVVPLRIPSLRSLVASARKALIERRDPHAEQSVMELFADDAHLMTRVQLVLTHAGSASGERTDAGLRLAVQLSGATSGFILCPDAEGTSAVVGSAPDTEVLLWTREQLAASMDDEDTVTGDDGDQDGESGLIELDGQIHRATMLWHPGVDRPVAALVLSSRTTAADAPDGVRRALAAHLWESRTETLSDD